MTQPNPKLIESLLIATANAGKAREFADLLASSGARCRSLLDLPGFEPVEETGATFRANACLKASGYARQSGSWALADDSGLEVDALGGAPGVYSARWAEMNGAGAGDADNNRLLLRQLEAVETPRRSARFVCILALADPQGRVALTAHGAVEGRLLREPIGANGFGYDPLFFIESLGQTTAQLSPNQKHRISHRGQALRRLADLMQRAGLAVG